MNTEESQKVLGLLAFSLLVAWRVYWYISEQKAEREKPKTKENLSLFHPKRLSKYGNYVAFGIVGVQLLGVKLFDMPEKSFAIQLVGFLLVCVGLGIAVKARKDLGTNWANCFEYQVKKKQEVVTNGIYRFIRHPIYTGIALFLIGGELVVQSYLVYVFLLSLVAAHIQANKEESLLVAHFGDQYRNYMKRSKRFIPFIW